MRSLRLVRDLLPQLLGRHVKLQRFFVLPLELRSQLMVRLVRLLHMSVELSQLPLQVLALLHR